MDFIITWVNGNDPEWKKEYYKYKDGENMSTHSARFRDWDNLQYWFRGVEKFAPWVDKIHFVTWGHLPEWLNTKHPKLNIVKHEDYIPGKYLPTFNSRTIDTNFHRIEQLNEEYVYFNDDMFLLDKMGKEDFFKDGKPCDQAALKILSSGKYNFGLFKNTVIINRHFSKWKTIREKPLNWFNFKYSKKNFLNLLLLYPGRENFSGFAGHHLAHPSKKSTLNLLWDKEYDFLDEASRSKFRDYYSVNHYLQRYWELASNNFYPVNMKKQGSHLSLNKKSLNDVTEFIENQKKPMLCINDHVDMDFDLSFEDIKTKVICAFDKILPEKSEFEK